MASKMERLTLGEGEGEGAEGGADGGGDAGAGGGGGGLDAEEDDFVGAVGQEGGELADGGGVGAEVAALNGFGIESTEGAGGEIHFGGVEQDEEVGVVAADEAGEIFGGCGGGDAEPLRMAEGAGEERAEGVIAVAGVADAEEEVHGDFEEGIQNSEYRIQNSEFRMGEEVCHREHRGEQRGIQWGKKKGRRPGGRRPWVTRGN